MVHVARPRGRTSPPRRTEAPGDGKDKGWLRHPAAGLRGMTATTACPGCGAPLQWVAQYGQWWCAKEQKYYPAGQAPAAAAPAQTAAPARASAPAATKAVPSLWTQNFYRIRKKVLALTGQYWIEDHAGTQLGYSKQKLLRFKEDIRVYADQSMARELFQIRQTQ